MSFLAKLTFYDQGELEEDFHNILECSFEFNVATDRRGKRTENLRGGQISLLLESSQKEDFLQWMMDPNENRDGEIIFYKRDMMASAKKVFFGVADCIHYSEEFNAVGAIPMKTRITIAPFVIAVGDTEVKLWQEAKNI
jgi:hypothetical protein